MTSVPTIVSAIIGIILASAAVNIPSDDVRPSENTGTTHLSRAARIARQHGVDSAFIASLLRSSATAFNERFVRINVTNYAQKADYTHNHNELGIRKVRQFLSRHDSVLAAAEERFGVPPEVVAALLWVETKHGTVLGSYHVPSVYLSVLLSCEDEYLDLNTNAVMASTGLDSTRRDSVYRSVELRAAKKVRWAASQLAALAEIDKRGTMDVYALRGSWAGAFGLTQFLPSSYLSWAVDGNNDGTIDLYTIDDAIFSVANYLRANGWGEDLRQKRAAVFHYNNSQAYVDAVLTLASKARP
jgi:membrane-bound lytic murein transglycosylase B